MILYHYCSVESFFSIITSKKIRLSDLAHTNDSQELRYGFEHILTYFESITGQQLNEDQKKNIWKEYYGAYAICFSEKGDLLSQWRGYADDGHGVSIGFDLTKFGINQRYPWISNKECESLGFEKIIYNYKDFKNIINNNIIFEQRPNGDELINQYNASIIETMLKRQDISEFIKLQFFSILSCLIPFIKNSSFDEELEWRIVYYCTDKLLQAKDSFELTKKENLLDKQFRISNKKITSYYEYDFERYINNLPLVEIYLGPKCRLKKGDVMSLLEWNGYNALGKIEIKRSASSYND